MLFKSENAANTVWHHDHDVSEKHAHNNNKVVLGPVILARCALPIPSEAHHALDAYIDGVDESMRRGSSAGRACAAPPSHQMFVQLLRNLVTAKYCSKRENCLRVQHVREYVGSG